VLALLGYDLPGVSSTEKLLNEVSTAHGFKPFLKLLKEQRGKLVDIHLLVYLYKGSFVNSFKGSGERHRVEGVLL